MGMICSCRERGKFSASQTVAFSFCTRRATSTGLPIPVFGIDTREEEGLVMPVELTVIIFGVLWRLKVLLHRKRGCRLVAKGRSLVTRGR